MSEAGNRGGAAPALAAHSKDAATPGPTAASGTKGRNAPGDSSSRGKANANLSASACRAMDQATTFVSEQPIVAIAVAGVVGIALGVLFARR